jgi:wobble nucleotide-excising tRNase
MIERIKILKHVGRFIELQSRNGADHDFTELNVVFASNASGKSTLCDVLRSMTLSEPSYILGRKRLAAGGAPEVVVAVGGATPTQVIRFQNDVWVNADASPRIHIYDDRFVAENVLVGHHINVDQRRNLYGLLIGSRGIVLKQAVDSAEATLRTCGENFRNADTSLKSLLPADQTIDSFRDVPEIADVVPQIDSAREALASATQANSMAASIRQRPDLAAIPIAQIPVILAEVLSTTLAQTATVAEQKIREHLEGHTDGLDLSWVGRGHRATTGDGCPFCGQSMDGLDILQAYNAFFAGELQAQEEARNTLRSEVDQFFGEGARNRIRETFAAHETERAWWTDAAGFAVSLPGGIDVDGILTAHEGAHQSMISALDRKQADPANATALAAEEQQSLDTWAGLQSTLTDYNTGIAAINETLTQKKTEAGSIDLAPLQQRVASLEVSRRRHQQDVIDGYTVYDAALLARNNAQRAKDAANRALREQTNALFAQYGERINDLLQLFAAEFQIVCGGSNENYVSFSGGQPSGQLAIEILGQKIASTSDDAADPSRPSLANTLSGGDRSALALAFFLAKVEQEPDLSDCVIVFDDPFHSQDRSRQSRTIERIHALARIAKQVFVFSHDLDFARAMTPIHGVQFRTFILDPLVDQTTLESKDLPMPPSRAYHTKYTELTAFIASPADYGDRLTGVAVTLRTILEEYLQLKFPLRWTGQDYWFGTMIGAIRDATGEDPLIQCQGLVDDLTAVNEYSQRFHHRTTGATADVPDARELVTYARQTLSIIHQ